MQHTGEVIDEWKNLIDHCSKHIKVSVRRCNLPKGSLLLLLNLSGVETDSIKEIRAFEKEIDVASLQDLAQKTWLDSLDWSTLNQLIVAQRRSIIHAQEYLDKLS